MCTSRINSTTGKTIRKVISGNGFLDPTLPKNSDEASTPTSTPSATSNTCHQTREKNNGEALSILPRYSFQLILRLPSQRNHGSYTPLPSPITRSRPNRFSTKSGTKKTVSARDTVKFYDYGSCYMFIPPQTWIVCPVT